MSAPLNSNMIVPPIVHPESNRYQHRGQQVPTYQSNMINPPNVLQQHRQSDMYSNPASSIPPSSLLSRPLLMNRQRDEIITSNSMSNGTSAGNSNSSRKSLQYVPSVASNNSTNQKALASATSNTPGILTIDQTPVSMTNKRPPLSAIPPNPSLGGTIVMVHNDNKRPKTLPQQHHSSSVGKNNPYHSAVLPSSSGSYSSTCPRTDRKSL
jgi:hypothetical protein